MRVIAGTMKGRALKIPPSSTTRPMTQRVREALFSVLMSFGVQPGRVLDLYAGSGGIGIEALSRGADWCDFVDQSAAACAVIRSNLERTRFAERAAVHHTSVLGFVNRVGDPYDLVIMDPPYADPSIIQTLDAVANSRAVADGTIVVLGHWPRLETPEAVGPLARIRHRCHGDSCFSIYERVDEVEPEDAPAMPMTEE